MRLIFVSIVVVTALVAFVSIQSEGRITTFTKPHSWDVSAEPESKPKARLVSLAELDNKLGLTSGDYGNAPFKNYTPVVFWHGMGDTAYGSINIDRLALERKYPGMKVFSIQIGGSAMEDELAGYFANVNEQIDQACREILANKDIRASGAMNAIGFSQGAQFIRALVQRCPLRENGIRVRNLISLGGQHQGVFGLPNCSGTSFCDYIRYMLSSGAYESYVQEHLVQAQYWHDPTQEYEYINKNIFLPDINNEKNLNQIYKANLLALDNFVMVLFEQDAMVVPRESSLFAFYEPGQNSTIRPLEKSPLYLQDRLGLRQLNESGRLKMISIPGNHLQYRMSWFLNEIAAKYLVDEHLTI